MVKMPLLVLLLAVAASGKVLPDAVLAVAGDEGELEAAVSSNITSPSVSEGKQTLRSAAEKGVQSSSGFTGQRLVNPYVFIETASHHHNVDDGERTGRYIQVRAQGDFSGCSIGFVDIKIKAAFKYHICVQDAPEEMEKN